VLFFLAGSAHTGTTGTTRNATAHCPAHPSHTKRRADQHKEHKTQIQINRERNRACGHDDTMEHEYGADPSTRATQTIEAHRKKESSNRQNVPGQCESTESLGAVKTPERQEQQARVRSGLHGTNDSSNRQNVPGQCETTESRGAVKTPERQEQQARIRNRLHGTPATALHARH